MKNVFVFGPTDNSHVTKWNSFYEGCTISPYTLHEADNNKLSLIILRFLKVFSKAIFKKFDIGHVHFASSYGILFRLLVVRCNISIISIWGTDFNRFFGDVGFRYRIWGAIILYALKRYDYVNVPSLDIYQKLKNFGVDEEQLMLMQYGIELSKINDTLSEAPFLNRSNRFISVRNYSDVYNIDVLIKSFAHIDKNIFFELHIVGTGTPTECDRIKSLISELNDNRIHYIGLVNSEELIKRLVEAEYFVSIPSMDGLSLVVLEALACRCKGILSNIPAYQTKIFKERCEFIELSDISLFSSQIEAIILSKKLDHPQLLDLDVYDIQQNRRKFRKIIGLDDVE